MISFVIPAYNEEALLGRTIEALFESARALAKPFEVIVVDDASTDRTAEIAQSSGARVVSVAVRQIAAARNAGARAAQGERLFFLDADTILPIGTLRAAWEAFESGAVGGGAAVEMDREISRAARLLVGFWNFLSRRMRWAAGCFIFTWRFDFQAVGGFDESYFAGEEIYLSRALQKRGRFVILPSSVLTSGRKERLYPVKQQLRILWRVLTSGGRALRNRAALDVWYDGKREK